jgi:alkaline phosphatase
VYQVKARQIVLLSDKLIKATYMIIASMTGCINSVILIRRRKKMRLVRKTLFIVLLFCVLLSTVVIPGNVFAADNSNIFLSRDAEWKYLDNGVDLGTVWRATNFDDSTWKSGKAPLGFGDAFSETDPTLPLATTVDFGDPNNKYMTTYFRTTFNVNNLNSYSNLEVYIHVDDGAVVYINGTEAFRRGIADGVAVDYNTGAKFSPKEETFSLPVTVLQEGSNTIAAEVHQDDGTSSDLWFEMSIKGITSQSPPPDDPQDPVIPDPNAPIGTVSKVTVTFNGDPATSKGFTWYTTLASANNDLQVVEKTGSVPDFSKAVKFTGKYSISTNSTSELLHKAEATGLKANTSYFFRVGDAALGIWSDTGTFQTAPQSGAFTFIDLTDTQAKTEDEAVLSSQTIAKALATVSNARFLALNGDIVDTGSNEQQWNWLLGHAQESLLNTTFVPAAGNHESQTNSFIEHVDIKPADNSATTSGAYYSYNYSNAHFIVLNNNEDSTEYADFTPAQIQWMRDDVQAARTAGAQWIIVVMHKGPYTTSNHATDSDIMGSNGVRTKVAPIMSDLGIDLVLQGHDHIYARSKPIKDDGTAASANKITETLNVQTIQYTVNPDGTIYLIPNTAGPKVYYKNKTIDPSYYDLFEVADEHHAAVYGPDPSDPSRPVRSQIQNFEGITIDDNKLTVVSYEIDQDKNNAEPYIIDQFGISKVDKAASAAKNVILLIGDGMGYEHIKAAREAAGGHLNMDDVNDATGSVTTYSADNAITDSAPAATALATGYKANNNWIGMTPDKTIVPTILEIANTDGKATGLVTTTQIAHATPAGFASHVVNRNMFNTITAQYFDNFAGKDRPLNVLMGAGKNNFTGAGRQTYYNSTGNKCNDQNDTRELLTEFTSKGYAFADNAASLASVSGSASHNILGLFGPDGGMTQERKRDAGNTEPHLADMTSKALEALAANSNGFFLMVEGGQIDWAAHANDFNNDVGETLAFDKAVKAALDFQQSHPDTLVIVTADHETGGLTYTDPSHYTWSSLEHTAALVPVMAEGPGAELFSGNMDNTDIPRKMAQDMGLDKPLVLQHTAVITGLPAAFTVTSMGKPVPGAIVSIKEGTTGNNTLASLTADAAGNAAYTFTKSGDYRVFVTKEGYLNSDTVALNAGTATTGATISGLSVLDGNQQPVTGALTHGSQYYLKWKARKNSDGSLPGLAIVEALYGSQPYFLNAASLQVAGGQDTEYSVLFQPSTSGAYTIKGLYWSGWSNNAAWQSLATPVEASINVN